MTNLTNFRFDDRRRRHRARDLGHARPLDERHHRRGDGRARRRSSTTVAGDAAIKGCVITSGKDGFSGGADLTMLQGLGAHSREARASKGEEAAMRVFFEESRKLSLLYRRLETCGKPFAAAINGVCLGGAFELALACHHRVVVRRRRDPRRPARGQGRALPRRRRHAARGAADADRRRAADAVQGRADPPADGARTWASCTRSRRATRSSSAPRPGSAAAARPSRPGTRRASSCPPARSTRRRA